MIRRRELGRAALLLHLGAVGCDGAPPPGSAPPGTPGMATPIPGVPGRFVESSPAGAPTPAASDVVFTPPGAGFVGQLSVTLSIPGGQGAIHYTLDGTLPNETSPTYTAPLTLTQTTQIRAVVVGAGAANATAGTFVALAEDAASFSSNLPVMILERHGDEPIDTGSNEFRASSALLFEPTNGGRSVLSGPATTSGRAGVRVRGQSSRGFPQKSYSVELWEGDEDEDRHYPLLGMPSESDWVLNAPSEMDRSLMRTMLPMDLSREIGVYAPRTRFIEVFLVDRPGSTELEAGDYVGVYTLCEKIKRDPGRVNVAKLDPPSSGGALDGGFIFSIDHGENHFDAGGREFQWVYPEPEVMRESDREPQLEFLRSELDELFEAFRQESFTHPETGRHYRELIDVSLWIDHNLLVALSKNVDGLRLSAYFHKDTGRPIVAGPIWDFDRSQGTPYDGRATNPENWSEGDGTHPLEWEFWGQLFEDPEFEAAYWTRWDELARGSFAADRIIARIDAYETTLSEARERHFERWAERPPEESPAHEVDILRNWYRDRVRWIDSQRP